MGAWKGIEHGRSGVFHICPESNVKLLLESTAGLGWAHAHCTSPIVRSLELSQ